MLFAGSALVSHSSLLFLLLLFECLLARMTSWNRRRIIISNTNVNAAPILKVKFLSNSYRLVLNSQHKRRVAWILNHLTSCLMSCLSPSRVSKMKSRTDWWNFCWSFILYEDTVHWFYYWYKIANSIPLRIHKYRIHFTYSYGTIIKRKHAINFCHSLVYL